MADPNITTRADSRNSGAKHTEGPWFVVTDPWFVVTDEEPATTIVDDCGFLIASAKDISILHNWWEKCTHVDHWGNAPGVTYIERPVDEAEANARLIAAAPEMYDLLASIENDAGQVPEWLWNRIQAVLKRARGE